MKITDITPISVEISSEEAANIKGGFGLSTGAIKAINKAFSDAYNPTPTPMGFYDCMGNDVGIV